MSRPISSIWLSVFALILVPHSSATDTDSNADADTAVAVSDAKPEDAPREDRQTSKSDDDFPFVYKLLNFNRLSQPQPPLAPVPQPVDPGTFQSAEANVLSTAIFGAGGISPSLLSEARRARALTPGADVVFGGESFFRQTTDAGNLLRKSPSATGVRVQTRTPIVNDPRVRGDRIGRMVASGSYWVPARQDLDTALSKIDSRWIEDIIIVKGPYSSRYGPGFDFADFQIVGAPRYYGGYETHGSTSFEYGTNGEPIYGRTDLWGGSDNWGFRIGYGHRTANDYSTGIGTELPTSYKSRDLNFVMSYDLSPSSYIEFSYLRLDQTDVEFPGLVFDINALVTDGFDLKYVLENQTHFDEFALDVWYNKTRFHGDTFRTGKNRQIPSLAMFLAPFDFPGLGPGNAITDVDSQSTGYRASFSWGDPDCNQLTFGTDLILINQQLNDIEDPGGLLLGPSNFPIPRSHSHDVGIFFDYTTPVSCASTVTVGGRADFVSANARNNVPDFLTFPPGGTITDVKDVNTLDQHFMLWSLFVTADHEINDVWSLTAGAGHGQRPPTLTELYATDSFIGSLQPGLTILMGDPQLDAEKRTQLDLGIHADYCNLRMSLNGFHAWVNDYITYEDVLNNLPFVPFTPGTDFQRIAVGNTELATLSGFEFAAEGDLNCWLTGFATVSYVDGRDQTRNRSFRMANFFRGTPATTDRSLITRPGEALPGIPPLESRLGIRLHEPTDRPSWLVELEARVVDNQSRFAGSLFEAPTAGFTVWNVRGYWQAADDLTIVAGVENFTDKFYREHLDYRSGLGVFQPGVNFYMGVEKTY
jgi:outer membrane receptor protein involved in Fe transport